MLFNRMVTSGCLRTRSLPNVQTSHPEIIWTKPIARFYAQQPKYRLCRRGRTMVFLNLTIVLDYSSGFSRSSYTFSQDGRIECSLPSKQGCSRLFVIFSPIFILGLLRLILRPISSDFCRHCLFFGIRFICRSRSAPNV